MNRVETYDEAEIVITPYGSSDNRRWFRVHDFRPGMEDCCTPGSLQGFEGDRTRIRAAMKRNGVSRYLLTYRHKCEHAGCRKLVQYKFCAFHSKPEDDVVFCAMTGTVFRGELR